MIERAQGEVQQLAERYLAGQLTADEVREFEESMLERPEVLAEVELARTVRLGLRTLRARGELESLVRAQPRNTQRWFATAAAVALAVVGYWWIEGRQSTVILASSLSELGSSRASGSISGEYLVARVRGADTLTIDASSAQPVIALRVLLPAASKGRLQRVELLGGGARLVTLDATGQGDYLHLYLDSSHLEPGDYELRIGAADGGVPSSTHRLRFQRKGR
jgi:hypothetical protein